MVARTTPDGTPAGDRGWSGLGQSGKDSPRKQTRRRESGLETVHVDGRRECNDKDETG